MGDQDAELQITPDRWPAFHDMQITNVVKAPPPGDNPVEHGHEAPRGR